MHEQLQRLMSNHATLLENLRSLAQQFEDMAKIAAEVGHQINLLSALVDRCHEPSVIAPRDQWPEIGHTTALEFVDTPDGFILRGTVDIKCASNRLAQTLHTAQATMLHLQSLLEMAGRPLPDPPKVPLVGDDEPPPRFEDHAHEAGSCICDT